MATLTVNFTTTPTATKYRIKYRKVGTLNYSEVIVTASPATITGVPCGFAYEGTIHSICVEGIPCNRYKVQNTSPSVTGTLTLTDCATGYQASMAIAAASEYYVCSRDTPVPSAGILATTTVIQTAQDNCVSPQPEEVSANVYWIAPQLAC
jgi:hypothetical protein